jgi:hypothetical protein
MKHDLWMAVRENSKDFVSECLPDEFGIPEARVVLSGL